jgi:elongation factor G
LDVLNKVKLAPDSKRVLTQAEIKPVEVELIEKYREEIVEALAEIDDVVGEAWMEGQDLNTKSLLASLPLLFGMGEYIPVCFGSAKKQLGIRTLLNTLKNALPKIKKSQDEKDWAMVLKARWHPKKGRIFLIRCLNVAGFDSLAGGLRLYIPHGQDLEEIKVENQVKGDLYILTCDEKNYKMGDVLGFDACVNYPGVKQEYPSLLESSLEAKDSESFENLKKALALIEQTDPSYKIEFDENHGVWWVRAMGEVHLEVLLSRLKDEFEVDADFAAPKVQKKQGLEACFRVDGNLQMGEDLLSIKGEFFPLAQGVKFENKVTNELPGFISAVAESVLKTLADAGSQGQGHFEGLGFRLVELTSEGRLLPGQFQKLLMDQFRLNLKPENTWTKEPLMQMQISLDDEYCGQVLNDLQSKNAQIEQVQKENHGTSIQAKILLSESFGYTTDLRTLSKGQASFSMEFNSWKEI